MLLAKLRALILGLLLTVSQAGEVLRIVAGHSVIADLAQRMVDERFQVDVLVPPGQCPHTYRPTPEDVRRLAQADLILLNGLGFEGWFEPLTKEARLRARVLAVSQGIAPLTTADTEQCPCGDEGHAHVDHTLKHETVIDPHAWNSLRQGIRYAENIRDALLAIAPAEAATELRARADALIRELRRTDAWAIAELAQIPRARRVIVTNHAALGYFARDYGFRIVAPLGPMAESQPSAREITRIVAEIRTLGVPAVFFESGKNPKLIERIAEESGVRIAGSLYVDGLGPPGSPAESYIAAFRHNVQTIVAALK
ncbi:MAG: zinc ABC transporter substrate-binding protein [Planctomycetota bacterium]|nr:zinc ABC transporter substrate-binding protein [Planctomycetota bacterium]